MMVVQLWMLEMNKKKLQLRLLKKKLQPLFSMDLRSFTLKRAKQMVLIQLSKLSKSLMILKKFWRLRFKKKRNRPSSMPSVPLTQMMLLARHAKEAMMVLSTSPQHSVHLQLQSQQLLSELSLLDSR